jgi:hypothetical protein
MIKKGIFDTWHVMVSHDQHNYGKFRLMRSWCFDNIALNDSSVSYHCRKYSFTYERFPTQTNFVFDREVDAIMFALRWT